MTTTDKELDKDRVYGAKGTAYSWKEITTKAKGNWGRILEEKAPSLGEALASVGYHVPCPNHGGVNGYRLFEHFNETGRGICNSCGPQNSGVRTLAFANKIPFAEALDIVAEWLAVENRGEHTPVESKKYEPKPTVPPEVAYAKICEVWKGSQDLANSPAELYLEKRGLNRWLNGPCKTLRSHPSLPNVEIKTRTYYGHHPCLIAPIRDSKKKILSIHRIYLTKDGDKANVPEQKVMMARCGDLRGSAIQMFPADSDVLGIAEGIETALAAHAVSLMPIWASVNAALMQTVEIPEHVRHVVVWADNDRSGTGLHSAEVLADRLVRDGKRVTIYIPPGMIPEGQKSVDWLDVLNTLGPNGFPAAWRKWRPAEY
ncbi:toprim domain-containing protein [Nostoc sp. CHAB 5834]|nr:toprim domain-containing protein [Nostoc sp. CHAB 5834]